MIASPAVASRSERAYLLAGYRRAAGDLDGGVEQGLAALLREVLDHPGAQARAQITFVLARAFGAGPAAARDLAVAVECFHTASLLFDDLPAMDDARQRRGRPCPHRVWGEGHAILGALALVTEAYALIGRRSAEVGAPAARRMADLVRRSLGVRGVLDGQARDLAFASSPSSAPRRGEDVEVLRVARGKTVALLRLALLLPACFAGREDLESGLDRLAEAWGLAYQALDDLHDAVAGHGPSGKAAGRDRAKGRPNLARAIGEGGALRRVASWLEEARRILAELGAGEPALARLEPLQQHLERDLASFGVPALATARCA